MVTLDTTAKKNVTLTVGFRKNATEKLGSVVVVVRPDGGDQDAIKVYCLYLIFVMFDIGLFMYLALFNFVFPSWPLLIKIGSNTKIITINLKKKIKKK